MPESAPSASEAKIEMNDHHGVPQSFLGSNDGDTNLTRLAVPLHNAFHQMAGHLPPASFIRKLVLASVNWHENDGKMLPVGFYRDVLEVLTPKDWRHLYHNKAIRPVHSEGSATNSQTKSAIHIYLNIWEEQRMVADAIQGLGVAQYISKESRIFSNEAMLFFQTDNPADAIREYLVAENDSGQRLWTKPFTNSTQENMVGLTSFVETEQLTLDTRRQLLQVLNDHHVRLGERAKQWQPVMSDSLDSLATYGQARHADLLQKRR